MEIKHELVDRRGAFRAFDGDTALGSMAYVQSTKTTIIVRHTGVEEAARGQGIARKLFEHLVNWARENAIKVVPQCPFTHRMFMENPETQDVLR